MLQGSEGNNYEYQMSWLAMTGGIPAGLTRGAGKGAEDKSVRIRMCTPRFQDITLRSKNTSFITSSMLYLGALLFVC